ncbi:MAG TPA: hypothetical protein VH682_03340 [Gemmataceae bacterium]|jgi:hypothetical protein
MLNSHDESSFDPPIRPNRLPVVWPWYVCIAAVIVFILVLLLMGAWLVLGNRSLVPPGTPQRQDTVRPTPE